MVDLYLTGAPEDDEVPPMENEDKLHEGCEKRIRDLKDLLGSMQEKNKLELDSVKSMYEERQVDSRCTTCSKNGLLNGEGEGRNPPDVSLKQFYKEQLKELGNKYSSLNASRDLELKVYKIKEEVRKDYESEIDKIREEIIANELKRKDEEINNMKLQMKEAHKIEVEKLWLNYKELANKEAAQSVKQVKNEVFLSQEIEDKTKLIEQLKSEIESLSKHKVALLEQKRKELEQLKTDLTKAHKKETENMKQAFEIEMITRVETVLEEKALLEKKLKKQIERLQADVNNLHSERSGWQEYQNMDLNNLTDGIRKETLHALEFQIKALVASGDEGEDKSQWPPELAALERQFTSRYERQLAQLVEEHALEIAEIKAEYDAKLSEFVKEYSIKNAEETTLATFSMGDIELDKIVKERDNLRCLALTMRQVVQQLARYLTTCEDELNHSIVDHLLKLASPSSRKVQISVVDSDSSDSDEKLPVQKKVHFAPDVSSIVSLMDEDYLFDCLDSSVDVSVHFRSELEACLERLKGEAAAVLGLTQARGKTLPSSVEERRLTSLTRQLIEEKKSKEEANTQLRDLQETLRKYEKELNDVQKELSDTKEQMMKEKVAVESEFLEARVERIEQKQCLLQEKARTLLNEKGDCPPPWLGLIEELCAEGDALIEEAWKAREEGQLEVEAADKQLRSTRAFLEEQAFEREQEQDEASKKIARLTELLKERDRDWTSHKQIVTEVEALEQQVKETTELLKETEENKTKVEKELKAAVDKIWVLRDIISELEVQVSHQGEAKAALEDKVSELQAELNIQAQGQADLLAELQTLRDCAGDQSLQNELTNLHDQLHAQGSSVVVRQIKSQLRQLAKSLEKQIKELEAVNIHVSSASLSSPSEDISIREHLEAQRCLTPEDRACHGSPPSPLPVEEINQLSDKLLRYSRAAENAIKKLRDRDMEIARLRAQGEEVIAERDVLQGQCEKQLLQLATLGNKIEEMRLRSERDTQACTAPLHQRILELETINTDLSEQLKDSQRKLTKLKQKLDRSEAVVHSQEAELSSLSEYQQDLVHKLKQDLGTMKSEKQQLQAVVEKYRTEDSISFPQLMDVMLAEKNADIDQLQHRVAELSAQQEQGLSKSQNQQSKSRGFRVSFADDVTHSRLAEGDRARDAHYDGSSIKPFFSTPLSAIEGSNEFAPRVIVEDLSKIQEPAEFNPNLSPNRAEQLESVLSRLKSELEQKSRRLLECEDQLPILEQELSKTKEELLETVRAVSEDKHFYEEQLKTLGQTQQLLAKRESEVQEVRAELQLREEDIVKNTADFKALQVLMEGLQQKLQEAKTFVKNRDDTSVVNDELTKLKITNNKYKEECEVNKNTIVSLKEQLSQLNKTLKEEKEVHSTLREAVDKLEIEKEHLLSKLGLAKTRYKSLQEELEVSLSNAKASHATIEMLTMNLEVSLNENKNLNGNCQQLKKELERLTKKQKTDLKNVLRKDYEEAVKVKEELESLKLCHSELQSQREELRQELNEMGNNLEVLRELNKKDDEIVNLEEELRRLEQDNSTLKAEKMLTEDALHLKISELQSIVENVHSNSLKSEFREPQEERDRKISVLRKYEVLKREYDRQRRARREIEKKCCVLKDELAKEKRHSAYLQNRLTQNRVPKLEITKANLLEITSDGTIKHANSLDNLTDKVQQELNASAQLDQSLITGLQHNSDTEVPRRSDSMPPRIDYLTARLAEVETALHVEQVVVSELRARLTEERAHYLEEHVRAEQLQQEVTSLHTLNDQFQDKFKGITHQLELQVNEIKDLRLNMKPADTGSMEKEKLKQLAEENQRRVHELLQEREFNRNQLLYLREELEKQRSERDKQQEVNHRPDNSNTGTSMALERRIRELEQEHRKNGELQKLLTEANHNLDRQTHQLAESTAQATQLCSKVNDLKKRLSEEIEQKKCLEEKIKAIESTERSRYSRRKAVEEKLKEQLSQLEKNKKELERECLGLHLKLKQSHLQLTAQSTESPLSLRLREANLAVERLVGEKEDLNSSNVVLKEEKQELQRRLKEQDNAIEDLKLRIHTLNIKVTDGGLDNLNAMFAAERAAWLKEKESFKLALAQRHTNSTDSFNSYGNAAHILQRYLRAESHRKALVWQKRYLLVSLRGYQEEEKRAVEVLGRFSAPSSELSPSAEHRFRVAVNVVRAVSRMQFLVEHRKRTQENTCRVLQHALNSNRVFTRKAVNVPELQTLWKRTEEISSSSSLHPSVGSVSQYIDRFNTIQDRIKNTLSTAS